MIGVLNIGIGNVRSVVNAVREVGLNPIVIRTPAECDSATHLILPGVGQFATAMARLRENGFDGAIVRFAESGRPVLGICLGMQLLAEAGEEGGDTAGLGLIAGRVRRLVPPAAGRLPHVGWNTVSPQRAHPVLQQLKPDRDFYFVHSYVFDCDRTGDVVGLTSYGESFPSVVGRGNAIGFQFHAEKSQVNGLNLIEAFCQWNGTC